MVKPNNTKKSAPIPILEKPPRPIVLGGITVKVTTGCGSMYVQLNWYQGRLFEIFATHGHGGGCAACEMEALTRSITQGLKCGVPVIEYTKQLKGMTCPNPMPFPRHSAVMSCPDGIGKTLEKYGIMPVDEIVKLLLNANGHSDAVDEEAEMQEAIAQHQELARERREQGI